MTLAPSLEDQVDALRRGAGVLDLDGWLLVGLAGAGAERWLNDLVTANVSHLPAGDSVRSLLLGPTGRIRADLLVHRGEAGLVLLQPPGQPAPIDALLEPYVLSSDVRLEPLEDGLSILPRSAHDWVVAVEPPEGATLVRPAALESWRIALGVARFPADLDESSLPAEAGLDAAPIIDRDKGCYLGQEAVAKVRNLGHPARLVVAVEAAGPVTSGRPVVAGGDEVGLLTSVDDLGGGRLAIARIRWDARDSSLEAAEGIPLTRR